MCGPRKRPILLAAAFSFCPFVLAAGAQNGPSQIGREVAIPRHLHDGEEYQLPISQLIAFGEKQLPTLHLAITSFQRLREAKPATASTSSYRCTTYFFSPSAAQTSMPATCTQVGGAGYYINVSNYVAAQDSSQVSQSGMAPGENLGDGGGWHDAYANPTTTGSDGSFHDTPFGTCYYPVPSPPTHHCDTGRPQSFRLTANNTIFPIATNTTSRTCTDGIQLVIQGNPTSQNKTYAFGNIQ
jgi:hypothetical protein